jgi:hypothetical protein
MLTVVGAISGNWEMGNCLMAKRPVKTIMTDMTMANTGLFINFLNIFYEIRLGTKINFPNNLSCSPYL